MGYCFQPGVVKKAWINLGAVKSLVATELCNKYPGYTVLSSLIKALLRSLTAKIRKKPISLLSLWPYTYLEHFHLLIFPEFSHNII